MLLPPLPSKTLLIGRHSLDEIFAAGVAGLESHVGNEATLAEPDAPVEMLAELARGMYSV